MNPQDPNWCKVIFHAISGTLWSRRLNRRIQPITNQIFLEHPKPAKEIQS